MKTLSRVLVCLTVIMCSLSGAAQSNGREYIRNSIRDWGECRNVAITRTNGDVALYGRNGTSRSSCPSLLNDKLIELNNQHCYIDDVCLTEDGNWVILYDDNCFWWNGIPSNLENKLRQFNGAGEKVTSVTFNDNGEWIAITTTHIAASSSSIQDWLLEGCSDYGALWSAHMTEDGIIAVYENGYKYRGSVPDDLRSALHETEIDVYRAKFAGQSWFFADKDGNYQYNM